MDSGTTSNYTSVRLCQHLSLQEVYPCLLPLAIRRSKGPYEQLAVLRIKE